ncbi:hypothetical protein [Mucilaginibacter gossypii]|uniref:TonB-dependent receptor plug domain-containing protein n=1 Tax=Mucilaginibacter gossypii TaxID=551996 RepID=A0A1G7XZ12_9SPHI|nr:hypothetical protein [Mucilaginibacter gossypii]SDG89266.1 hypothetical protein SAMN05192573_105215 [Mucilaginibacter gossypii]
MKPFRITLFAIFLLYRLACTAQTNTLLLNKAVNSLNKWSSAYPTEKVYLHLNKPNYLPGDTIWFKAYTVIGPQHQLSALSSVLYVELINPKDSVINRKIFKLASGTTRGEFALGNSIIDGTYHVRAYTNWMRNAGTDYFYDQSLQIGGIEILTGQAAQQHLISQPDVQFFPEGGFLINGLRSKVAIKVLNAAGLGEDVSGIITDNTGTVVTEFSTQHLGMGVFALTPQKGKNYKVQITDKSGTKFSTDLPLAKDDGLVLTVNNSMADSLRIKITPGAPTFAQQRDSTFYLIGQVAGKVYYTTAFKLSEQSFLIKVEKNRFPSGILQLTLLGPDHSPINERVVFIRGNDNLKLAISGAGDKARGRQKMSIDIKAVDIDNKAVVGSFSVAVINESRVSFNEDAEPTIINNLLFTSDIKGFIEKPNYYFTNIDDKKNADLDILMLTQGYRRFDWANILDEKLPAVIYKPEDALTLTGTLKSSSGGLLSNGKISLTSTADNLFIDTVTDANGDFKFSNLDLSDTSKIVLRARKQNNGKNVSIYVKQPDYPVINKSKHAGDNNDLFDLSPEQIVILRMNATEIRKKRQIDSLKNGVQLKEVKIKGEKNKSLAELNRYGTIQDRKLDMSKLRNKNFSSLGDALFWTEPLYFGQKSAYIRKPAASPVQAIQDTTKGILVDGISYTPDILSSLLASEIESIHIIAPIDPRASAPIIVITTKRKAGTDTTVLKQVNITAKRINKKPDMSYSKNLNGPGNADQVIMGDKIGSGCIRLSDCLIGRVFGVYYDKDGSPRNTRGGGKMSVIVDGNILNGYALNNVNANDIYSIEVLRSGASIAIYGSSVGAGALVITTKRGNNNFVTSESPSGLITYPFKGFSKSRVFYSPKYRHTANETEGTDLRNAIYWQPGLFTDKDGKATFEYFNADTKGTYRIVIEGIDADGNLGRQVYRYKVE